MDRPIAFGACRSFTPLSRTLRARDNGAADKHPLLVWRFAPHNQRIKPTPGGKAFGSPALRGLSAAPLGLTEK
ncbi:MAG: hypothetical protein WAV07_18085, partial [Candidatus Contendobacter sp.]